MAVLSRSLVRGEIATGLTTALVGTGKPVKAVYAYQKGSLGGESPAVLVLSGTVERGLSGMGTARYSSEMGIEIHILIYDGTTAQPLTETQREDKADEIEAAIATWVAANQRGTYYRALRFAAGPSERGAVKMLDGNAYSVEILKLEVEAPDL